MTITIHQGNDLHLQRSHINIVIDVIRAFTVAHYAFLGGVNQIFLVNSTEDAFLLKHSYPDFLLAGEEKGIPIKGFDLGNSPKQISQERLFDKTLVQKTTNGVKATLHSLNTKHLFVTGFSNAKTTANHVRTLLEETKEDAVIHIIASHPTGDDDLACADYIKDLILGKSTVRPEEVMQRITNSHVTEKFFNVDKPEFDCDDIRLCIEEKNSDFVMEVNKHTKIPVIERKRI
ncbi:2-phosphosulfolactate phosphatase [Alkalihalobacillus sp. MEB130]|uniref:2-phosphosulfolactate phosphatase n=1 Tax=Alkalihalobacillus sp. MEB130 TaxID=2976704 RepID=UPI0028DE2354|nr:2-phosphosulfolactate phosphatase [Alkalihalobacillus sp. MEB130]MDT8859889.1 2-phosphosulfolactate phosphatase [Alkalihalobacillus sp. MEB130]